MPSLQLNGVNRERFLRLIDEKRFMDACKVLRQHGYTYKQTKILTEITMQEVHPDYAAQRQRCLDQLLDELDSETE